MSVNLASLSLVGASSQYASIPDWSGYASSSYTFEAWVKFTTVSSFQVILGKDAGGGPNRQFAFGASNGRLYIEHYDNGGTGCTYLQDNSNLMVANVWYHVAVVNSAGTFKFYRDGVELTASTFSGTYGAQGQKAVALMIGCRLGSEFLSGLVDEVRFWNTARSGANILANKDTELVGNETGLVGYWKCNQGAGTKLKDYSATGFAATTVNSPTFSTDVPFAGSGDTLLLEDLTPNNNHLVNVNGVGEIITSLPTITGNLMAPSFDPALLQHLAAPDSASLSITGNITIEFWLKMTAVPADEAEYHFVSKWDGTSAMSFTFKMYKQTGGTQYLQIFLNSGGEFSSFLMTTPLSTATWYHVAVVWTASTGVAEFFINGVSIGSGGAASSARSINDTTAQLLIGAYKVSGAPSGLVNGFMDDVRIWNVLRSAGDINTNKGIRLSGNETGLVAYYPFEVALGGTAPFLSLL